MNSKIIASENFRKEAKRLLKKFKSLKEDLFNLESSLKINPYQGTLIGNNCYKLRLSIKSKSKGKRSGARVITFIIEVARNESKFTFINLISIYDKSEMENISDSKLRKIIQEIKSELT